MASGNSLKIPEPFYNFFEPVRTLTATIAGEMGEADQTTGSARYHVLFAMSLCLLVSGMALNWLSQRIISRGAFARKKGRKMKTSTRKILDKSFSALALSSMAIMCAAAVAFLAPIIINGSGAVWFKATVEHFKFLREVLDRGSAQELAAMTEKSDAAREKLYSLMRAYESPADFKKISGAIASARRAAFAEAAKKSAEFVKILDENKGAASAPVIKKFGEGIFADYSGLVSGAAKRSSSPAMAEFLAGEKEALQDGARAVLEDFAKIRKLGVLEKGRVRRELPAAALENLGAASEKVSEDNAAYAAFKEGVRELLGPMSGRPRRPRR